MVFSWFKKRGGQDAPAKSNPKQTKGPGAAKQSVAGGAAAPVAKPVDPLAQAAASVLQAESNETAEQALATLTDPKVITYVALQRSNLRDAAMALPQMRSEPALQVMEKQSRERNKTVNRFARNALDRIKTARRESSELRARAEELNGALGKHNDDSQSAIPYTQRQAVVAQLQAGFAEQAQQYQQLVTELAHCDISLEPFPTMVAVELEPPAPEPQEQAASDNAESLGELEPTAAAEQNLAQQQAVDALEQELLALRQRLAKDSGGQTASSADFANLMTQLPLLQQGCSDLESELEHGSALASAKAQLQELEQLAAACVALDTLAQQSPQAELPERPALDPTAPSDDALGAFASYQADLDAASNINKQQLRQLGWPSWAQSPASIASAFAQRDAIADARRWAREQTQGLAGHLDTTLNALADSLEAGQAGQSKTLMSTARRLKLAMGKIDPNLNTRMASLGSQLTELVDWQTFATSPKRQELVDAITQLAQEPLAPEAQANRVKQLRGQWNELGTASKAAERRLAEQFNAQAQIAFDHCREHFAQLAEQRAANSAQREQICQQLRDYLDATDFNNGDLKAAEQILRTARDAWRQCYPVERKSAKALEKTFEGLQQQLHDNIKSVWASNEQVKQGLLEQAQALVGNTEVELGQRINQAKDLQRAWQQVGPMPRGGERKLWLAFRAACDALFAERDGAKQAAQAQEQAAVDALAAQVDEFAQQLANTTVTTADAGALRAARNGFSAAQGSVSGGQYTSIKRRFDGLCKDYEALLQQQQREALHQRLQQLAEWDQSTTSLGEDAPVPESAQPKLLQGLPAAPSQAPTVEALHRLVLNVEILAEVPSPPADEALRLQLQVERLQQSMGQKAAVESEAGDARWIELALAWCAERPKPQTQESADLSTRYFDALRQALTPS